jgi:predicted HNH restriction endonuclease
VRAITDYRRKYNGLATTEARRKIKIKAVAYKGGKCIQCGYDKCPAVFEFHHTDPTQKDFGISDAVMAFDKLKTELDKTILLCANCHRELHDQQDAQKLQERKEELKKEAPVRGRPRKVP